MKGHEHAAGALISPIQRSSTDDGEPPRLEPDGSSDLRLAERDASATLRRRVLDLEAELRVLRALLEVRNESFRALMGRLVTLESREQLTHDPELAQLRAERDAAVELSTVLQNMKVFRYSKWPRAAYGVLLRLWRRG